MDIRKCFVELANAIERHSSEVAPGYMQTLAMVIGSDPISLFLSKPSIVFRALLRIYSNMKEAAVFALTLIFLRPLLTFFDRLDLENTFISLIVEGKDDQVITLIKNLCIQK